MYVWSCEITIRGSGEVKEIDNLIRFTFPITNFLNFNVNQRSGMQRILINHMRQIGLRQMILLRKQWASQVINASLSLVKLLKIKCNKLNKKIYVQSDVTSIFQEYRLQTNIYYNKNNTIYVPDYLKNGKILQSKFGAHAFKISVIRINHEIFPE